MTNTPEILVEAFQASGTPTASDPKVVTLPDGGYLVAYITQLGGLPGNDDGFHIRGKRFDAEGNQVSFEIPFTFRGEVIAKRDFDIEVLPNGNVVIGALVQGRLGDRFTAVKAQEFELNGGRADVVDVRLLGLNVGTMLVPEITVNGDDFEVHAMKNNVGLHGIFELDLEDNLSKRLGSFRANDTVDFETATLANGNFVFLVDRDGTNSRNNGDSKLFYRVARPDGTIIKESETGDTSDPNTPIIDQRPDVTFDSTVTALIGGGFVIAWTQRSAIFSEVFMEVFDAEGNTVNGNPTNVSAQFGVPRNNNEPSVAALADGGFIVFWDKDAGAPQIRGQRFDAEGNELGEQFIVANENGGQIHATLLDNGNVVVSYVTVDGVIKTVLLDGTPEVIRGSNGADELVGSDDDDTILGLDGNDDISARNGDDAVSASGGDDIVEGGRGNDTIDGDDGNDNLRGNSGNDTIDGGAGNDTIRGDNNNDLLVGGAGDDVLRGGAGNDEIRGDAGDDVLRGDAGNDTINGGDGTDTINGGNGADTILGGAGDDIIDGGQGADIIVGGAGSDVLTGGEGADVFVFRTGDGREEILDFDTAEDVINLAAVAQITDVEDLFLNHIRQVNTISIEPGVPVSRDVIIEAGATTGDGSGTTIILRDTELSDLSASNFDFSF